ARSAWLRCPTSVLPQRMRVGVFVDAGQVWERGQEAVTLKSLRVTPGVGFRFTTPLGPVRLDAAYNGSVPQAGPLLFQNDIPGQISVIQPSYRVPWAGPFWARIRFRL